MDALDQYLSSFAKATGSGFRSSINSRGVARDWIVQQLAVEWGVGVEDAGATVDRWAEQHPVPELSTIKRGPNRRDRTTEMLARDGSIKSSFDETLEVALLEIGFGGASTDAGDPFGAIARFAAARNALHGLGNVVGAAACDMKLAVVASALGWHRAARHLVECSRPIIARDGSVGAFARFLADEAIFQEALGAIAEGTDLLEKARWLAYEAEEVVLFAGTSKALAAIAAERGDFDTATDLLFEAREVYVDLEDPLSMAVCDLNAGVAMTESGNYEDGFTASRQALAVLVEYEQPVEAARARRAIAHSLDHLGKHDAALEELDKARVAFEDLGMRVAVAECDLDRSTTLRALGRFSDAASAVIQVREAYRKIGEDVDDRWFDETLAAIARGEVDAHDHPKTPEQ